MGLFCKRPFALFCILFTAATVCGCFLMPETCRFVYIFCGSLGLFLFILFIILPKKAKSAILALCFCVLFSALGFFRCYQDILAPRESLVPYEEKEMPVTLTVLEVRYQYNYGSSYLVRVERIGDESFEEKAILTYEFDPYFRENEILEGKVSLHSIESYSDYILSYLSDGITLYLEPADMGRTEADKPIPALVVTGEKERDGFLYQIQNINHTLSDIVTEGIGGEEGDLISSLLLGNQDLLSKAVMRDFRRAGIIHVLSISGMHLALMTVLSEFLMKRLRIHKNIRSVCILFIAFFYLALTGFALSTIRAFIMTAFVYAAYLFRSDNDPLTSLFAALFLILLIFPKAVYDVGMWLSFAATFGILITVLLLKPVSDALYNKLRNKKLFKPLNNMLSGILISFAASFCSFLPAWLFFDEISLLSIPATLLLSPIATFILYLAPFFLLFSGIPYIAGILAFLLKQACRLLLYGTSLFSLLPNATVSLHYPFEKILIPLTVAVFVILLLLPLRKKIIIPVSALCFTLVFFICIGIYRYQSRDAMTTEYLRDEKSELLLLASAESTVLCDISGGAYSIVYDALLRSKAHYATEINAYVLTHYHTLHIGSLRRLSEQVLVRKLYLPFPITEDEYYIMLSLLNMANECGIPVTLYDRGEKLPLYKDFTLFVSDAIYLKRSTHPTFYVAVQNNENLLLYLGESSHEDRLAAQLRSLIPKANTVIFGTHGPIAKTPIPFDLSEVPIVSIPDTDVLLQLESTEMPKGNWIVGSNHITVNMK